MRDRIELKEIVAIFVKFLELSLDLLRVRFI
jgi:hypothetical protein